MRCAGCGEELGRSYFYKEVMRMGVREGLEQYIENVDYIIVCHKCEKLVRSIHSKESFVNALINSRWTVNKDGPVCSNCIGK